MPENVEPAVDLMPDETAIERLALRWNLTSEVARRRWLRESQAAEDDREAVPDMKKAALWYARNGIPVFPLHHPAGNGCSCGKNLGAVPEDEVCDRSRGKHPRTSDGFKSATTDAGQIAEWWVKWPAANIGVPTGAVSRLLVLDCDPRNGGPATRSELIERCGPLPETAEAISGGDGRHTYLRYPGGTVPRSLAQGIDLKGDGGYVVAPPSLHMSGKRYQWDGIAGAKAILHPAEAPAWLLDFIRREPADGELRPAVELPETIPDGEKHNAIVSLAGTLRRRGVPEPAAYAACRALSFASPVSDEGIRSRVKDVYRRYPAGGCSRAAPDLDRPVANDASVREWPDELEPEAYHGAAGELVRLIEPHSESDPAALLIQFLVGFGNMIGRSGHFMAEADRHCMNLFAVMVGQTAKGRKGTSLGHVQRVLKVIDAEWCDKRNMGGLASGEGLIWAVRDEIRVQSPVRAKGRVIDYEEVVADAGEKDKRLMVVEPEFARVLQTAERESNTLSAIIRQAWDTGNLRILTKNQAARSTEAHISIIGHITGNELRRLLTNTAAGNGFANRFLWVCTRRSKLLPEGGAWHTVNFAPIIRRVQEAADSARAVEQIRRDEPSRAIWVEVYSELSEGKPGLLGSVTSRAEAQTMRLACIYASLDGSATIRAEHLQAGLAVWRYCEASAKFIFGDALGDATADEILRALRNQSQGLTRTQLNELFTRNKPAAEISRALGVLQEYGLARMDREEQGGPGRPIERWFAVTA